MSTHFAFDHVVWRVQDLAAASYELGLLGFTVVYGGEHSELGSHNALIPFQDGSYLELFAFRPSSAPRTLTGRMARWKSRGEGFVDFALVPTDIGAVIAAAAKRSLPILGPLAGGRARPDGAQVAWQLGLPESFDVPFLCADATPRALRVPEGLAREHPNGVTGIRRVTVGVKSIDASLRRWRALLGGDAVPGNGKLTVGSTIIDLVAADSDEGPCALELVTRKPDRVGALDPGRTRGATITLTNA